MRLVVKSSSSSVCGCFSGWKKCRMLWFRIFALFCDCRTVYLFHHFLIQFFCILARRSLVYFWKIALAAFISLNESFRRGRYRFTGTKTAVTRSISSRRIPFCETLSHARALSSIGSAAFLLPSTIFHFQEHNVKDFGTHLFQQMDPRETPL